MFDLNGKTALVTGSTQGIGFDIAKTLAEHGAKVFVHGAWDIEKCQKASGKIENSVAVVSDLTQNSGVDILFEKTGNVDILILNASIQYKRKWDDFSEEEFDNQMTCNFKSTYFLIKKYAEGMKKKGFGRIVTIGSVNQYNQHPELAIYGATKVAQKKLVDNIASDLAPFGVTVNNVAPGAINTPRNVEALSDKEFEKRVIASIPAGYIGQPCDVSPAVLLLCSDEGRYITGAEILIDGGMHL